MKTSKRYLFAGMTIIAALGLTACGAGEETTTTVPETTAAATSAAPQTTKAAPTSSPTSSAPATTKAPKPSKTAAPKAADAGTALAALAKLDVSDQTLSGYDRDLFPHWTDPDGNGCDTREDTLAAHMVDVSAPDGCKVQSGVLKDLYTGQTIQYVAGNGGGVDIDHVVALSAGWETGMANASATVREQFANDPLNLLPVDKGLNRAKGDKDASEWLPGSDPDGDASANCAYVARQIAVKDKYTLWVTSSEKSAMESVLSDCPNEPLPTDKTFPEKPKPGTTAKAPSQTKTTAPKSAPSKGASSGKHTPQVPSVDGADPKFGSCKIAKSEGYGPYVKGKDVEYSFYRDGDGDGTVCE